MPGLIWGRPPAAKVHTCSSCYFLVSKENLEHQLPALYSRAVRLECTPRCGQDGLVLGGLPVPHSSLHDLVIDRRLVDHVGHPGVPAWLDL